MPGKRHTYNHHSNGEVGVKCYPAIQHRGTLVQIPQVPSEAPVYGVERAQQFVAQPTQPTQIVAQQFYGILV